MILIHGELMDWKMDFLKDASRLFDSRLSRLERRGREVPDPEAWGVYDAFEDICGLGFVACQRYLTTVYGSYGLGKPKALALGPSLAGGLTVAEAVNNAANLWKHQDEWKGKKLSNAAQKTRAAVESFGGRVGDYPLSCVLAGLTAPPHRFAKVLPRLTEWRDTVRKAQPPPR